MSDVVYNGDNLRVEIVPSILEDAPKTEIWRFTLATGWGKDQYVSLSLDDVDKLVKALSVELSNARLGRPVGYRYPRGVGGHEPIDIPTRT